MIGLVSDLMAANRRILSDTQYHIRRMEYDSLAKEQEEETALRWEPHVVQDNSGTLEEKKRKQKIYNMC